MLDTPVKVGPVEVHLPPDPALVRMLRLTASGVASLDGFTVSEIEDIMVAVSEVFLALIEQGRGEPIDMSIWVADRAFNVRGTTQVDEFDLHHPDVVLARTVLSLVADEHEIEVVDRKARIWVAVKETVRDAEKGTTNGATSATNGAVPEKPAE